MIGAGVVGVSCGRWLQQDGHSVRVIDPLAPGQACSYGNAGVFATDSVVPLATPRTLRAAPGMLLRPDSGFSVRWRYLPRLLPWLVRFALCARSVHMHRAMHALTALCAAAAAGYQPLLQHSVAARLVRATGWATAFLSPRTLDACRWELEQRQHQGVRGQELDGAQLRERVPELGDAVAGGFWFPDCSMCTDPALLVRCLADDLVAAGGIISEERVTGLKASPEQVRVETAGGEVAVDHVVIAAGAWSGALARLVGDRFPLETERGYHAMIEQPGVTPSVPVMSGEHKFVTTPMREGVRLAGTTELGGLRLPPDTRRPARLPVLARRLFPGLNGRHFTAWMGFRSTLPDSLPVIGRSPVMPSISYAFGHQHLGLTLAGVTGRMLADELAGRAPPVDTMPVSAARFAQGVAAAS